MRVIVDRDVCARHGQCVHTSPEIFRFDDAGGLVHRTGELDENLRERAEEAADVCPMQAITLDG